MQNGQNKNKSFLESANYAIMGIISSFKHERNLRVHFLAAILILLVGLRLGISKQDLILLLLSITFVLMSEMMNTAIELLTDTFVDSHNPVAKVAKDVAAGAVLMSVIGALAVGYLVFYERLRHLTPTAFEHIKALPLDVSVVSLVLVMLLTIILKVASGRGTPLLGGMPSGHAALAFATATVVLWLTKDPLIISAAFFLALLVAQSRVQAKIHGWWEVTSGGVCGFLVTLILFKIFSR